MLVANSFDLWQRDAFFSAAEEVQQSTDILESAYRIWLRQKKEGLNSSDLEELRRELQTALGTAKWQLEEFERAVRLSYGNCRDQNRMTRHQQFVAAIESQISRIEEALRESLNEDGKQPLQWVNLDEDERDDLAMFLSGSCGTTKESTRHDSVKHCNNLEMTNLFTKKDLEYPACSNGGNMEINIQTSVKNVVINMESINCAKEFIAREAVGSRGNFNSEADQTSCAKGAWFSPKSGTSRIVIPNGDDIPTTVADTPKGKGFRISNFLYLRGINCINMVVRSVRCSSSLNSRMQSPQRLQLRLLIVLMLSFFLFVLYFLQLS
uniref:Syntaxin 6/10/61 N-terminal domain-containing protein n=1 Tax=Opuntia streptacantha TaxID=393608 RepID=A0A7C9ASY3_OPUST